MPIGSQGTVLVAQTNEVAGPRLLSLPDEILSTILIYLSSILPLCLSSQGHWQSIIPGHDLSGIRSERLRRLGWVIVAHVCSRLRNIALGMPTLWASIVAAENSMRWIPEVLHRSGDQPLWLSLYKARDDDDQEKACAILSEPCYLLRTKHITISTLRGWRPFVRTLLTQPAPQLEDLFMGPQDSSNKLENHLWTREVEIFTLFGTKRSAAPRLSRLALVQCNFLWSSLRHFPTLTVLSIDRKPPIDTRYCDQYVVQSLDSEATVPVRTYQYDSNVFPLDIVSSMKDVVTCLRALPCLKELLLVNALPGWHSTTANTIFRRIPLPYLNSLTIKQRSLRSASVILDLLDAPELDYCELYYWTSPVPTDDASQDDPSQAMLTRFLSNFTAHLPGPIHELDLKFWQSCVYSYGSPRFGVEDVTLSASCLSARGSSLSEHGCLRIAITLDALSSSSMSEIFPHRHACVEPIISALPLSNLNWLNIADKICPVMPEAGEDDLSHCVDFPLWQRIYSHCASATSISAKGLALVPLIPLLSTRNHPRWTFVAPPPEPRTPAFPRLKHLHLSVEGFDDVHRGVCICLVRRTGYYG